MDKKQLALIAFFLLHASTTFATNPASKEALDATIGATTLSPTDWNNLCPPGQSLESTNGCTPNINGAQKNAVKKLFTIAHIQSLSGIPITNNNGIIVFHITGASSTGYTIHNNSASYANCMGFVIDNFSNDPVYNNPNSNPLFQFSILNFPTGTAPATTLGFSPSNFYDYYAPTTVNDYMVCVGGSTHFNNVNNPSTNSSSSVAGLFISSP